MLFTEKYVSSYVVKHGNYLIVNKNNYASRKLTIFRQYN